MTTSSIASTLDENASPRFGREDSNPVEQMKHTSVTTNNDNNSLASFSGANNQISGEVNIKDVIFPRLQLSQLMSTSLQDNGIAPGSLALNGTLNLGVKVEVIVGSVKLFYQEALDYGVDDLPRIWDTEAAMEADGFTTAYNNVKPRADKVADFRVLLKAPVDDKSEMFTDISKTAGKWTQCLFTAKGTNYRTFAKPILTAAVHGHLQGNLLKGQWKITIEENSNGKNRWFSLKPTPLGPVDEKTQKALKEAFNLYG
jgi:hypothetical protein